MLNNLTMPRTITPYAFKLLRLKRGYRAAVSMGNDVEMDQPYGFRHTLLLLDDV